MSKDVSREEIERRLKEVKLAHDLAQKSYGTVQAESRQSVWEDVEEDLANNEEAQKKRNFSHRSIRNFEELYSSDEDSSELDGDSDLDYDEHEEE